MLIFFDFELSDEDMAIIDNMNRHRRTGPDRTILIFNADQGRET